jgi:hypothetical protein
MAKKKSSAKTAAIDVTAGQSAYGLAIEYRPQIESRLPAGMINNLAADLTTLGFAPPAPTPAPAPAAPGPAGSSTFTTTTPTPAAPPTLPVALSTVANLVSAIHESVRSGTTSRSVRKEYGAGSTAPATEVKDVLADASKIVTRATEQPSEALTLGILPADITALQQAIVELNAAETAAHGTAATTKTTSAIKRAATTRMDQAVAKIAGAGTLAFALVPATRALFEALRPKK